MKILQTIFLTLALLLTLSLPILCQTVSAAWQTDGWIITSTLTNTNPVAGTFNLVSDAVYTLDGVVVTSDTSTTALVMGASTANKTYTSQTVLNTKFTIVPGSGDGAASFDAAGKLVWNVTAINDGAVHTYTFKVKPKIPGWLMSISFIKTYYAGILYKSLGI